jgi:hypothetical protein
MPEQHGFDPNEQTFYNLARESSAQDILLRAKFPYDFSVLSSLEQNSLSIGQVNANGVDSHKIIVIRALAQIDAVNCAVASRKNSTDEPHSYD